MLASASGPLGALLMIAPLAAIPVFAVVGVPHFAPLSASPAEEDEVNEILDTRAPAAVSTRPVVRRSADDIFAPVGRAGSSREPDRSDTPRRSGGRSIESERHGDFESNRRPAIAHPDALDDWEIASNVRPSAGRREIGQERPGLDGDSLELPPEEPERTPRRVGSRTPVESAGDSSSISVQEKLKEKVPKGRTRDGNSQGFDPGLIHSDAASPSRSVAKGSEADRRAHRDRRIRQAARERAGGGAQTQTDQETAEWPGAPEQSGWRLAAKRLKELGIRKYRLESQIEDQQFLFRCEYPTPETPHVTELFEAVAETPLEAVLEALRQIDEWLQRGDSASDLPADLP